MKRQMEEYDKLKSELQNQKADLKKIKNKKF